MEMSEQDRALGFEVWSLDGLAKHIDTNEPAQALLKFLSPCDLVVKTCFRGEPLYELRRYGHFANAPNYQKVPRWLAPGIWDADPQDCINRVLSGTPSMVKRATQEDIVPIPHPSQLAE